MVGLTSPLTIKAHLQQGVVMDLRYGIALDGVLVSAIRDQKRNYQGGITGSLIDGGLGKEEPTEWDIPLAKCYFGSDWHWLATTGMPADIFGERVSGVPDPHRLYNELDEYRSPHIAVALPKNVGGPRGRFRTRVTPVLSLPANQLIWRAIGDPELIETLLSGISSVGGRRGSGEGSILKWSIEETSTSLSNFEFAHLHPDGILGRPSPISCAEQLEVSLSHIGAAGLRPPMFHSGRTHMLVLPDFS